MDITPSVACTIDQRPVASLIPYARNPRKNDPAVDRMVASIQEFGFKIPILCKSDGLVVDGHLRLKAAIRLGLDTVPVILCDEWTDAQVKAFRLMANRSVTWAEWDEELLGLELKDLQALDYDLSLTGFDEQEVSQAITAPEQLQEKQEQLRPIQWTRILVSIPKGVTIEGIDQVLRAIKAYGGEVDFGGN